MTLLGLFGPQQRFGAQGIVPPFPPGYVTGVIQ